MTQSRTRLVAIGGGELKLRETLPIDTEIVALTGKPHPNALFIPTASNDSLEYCATFGSIYGGELGCETEALLLNRDPQALDRMQELLDWADLVYVGGGSTKRMLERWRETGFDTMLRDFAATGRVVSGLSAGANCWFRYGNSDQPYKEGRRDIITWRIDGLGIVDLSFCPHTVREEYRVDEMTAMMRETPGMGIGVDDNAALQISGDRFRIIAATDDLGAYAIWWEAGTPHRQRLTPADGWRKLAELRADG
ncbi:MAG TPA: Type 1 glutamine amidotransferase-like domain-containing protein [Capsulimonadaceae bacterium]